MTTCLRFDHGQAREGAEFYASVFPDAHVGPALGSSADNPSTKHGQKITVEFPLLGRSFVGLNGGSLFSPNEAVTLQVFADTQEETDCYWKAIVGNGGAESMCSWCKEGEGTPSGTLKLVGHQVWPSETAIVTYEPAGSVEPGSFGPNENVREDERQRHIQDGTW